MAGIQPAAGKIRIDCSFLFVGSKENPDLCTLSKSGPVAFGSHSGGGRDENPVKTCSQAVFVKKVCRPRDELVARACAQALSNPPPIAIPENGAKKN